MDTHSRQKQQVFPARLDKSGRVNMPAELREALGISTGSRVHWVKDESGVRIETPEEALRALQDYFMKLAPPDRILSEELIAERRAEALRE